jgi:hypothetical protein
MTGKRTPRAALLASLFMSTAGCDMFQRPSVSECVALYNHIIDTGSREVTPRLDDDDGVGEVLAGVAVGLLGRAALEATLDKETFIVWCRAEKVRYEVASCLMKDNLRDIADCVNP